LPVRGLWSRSRLGYALVHEGPPHDLFVAVHHPGLGTATIALYVPGAARPLRPRPGPSLWLAGLLRLCAISLTVLELAHALGGAGLDKSFHGGHVALWSALAAARLSARRGQLEQTGLRLFALAVAEIAAFDVRELLVGLGSW
jgi:hypothetical protein